MANDPRTPQWPPELCCFFLSNPCHVSLSPVEGLKVVEIEKCKSDIKKMREELAARSNR